MNRLLVFVAAVALASSTEGCAQPTVVYRESFGGGYRRPFARPFVRPFTPPVAVIPPTVVAPPVIIAPVPRAFPRPFCAPRGYWRRW